MRAAAISRSIALRCTRIGTQVEALFGRRRFAAGYFLTALSGSVLSYAITNGNSLGASTSLYGAIGMLAVYFYKHRALLGATSTRVLRDIGITVVIGVVISLLPGSNIGLWGHVGGMLGGLLLGWFLAPTYARTDPLARAFDGVIPANRRPELINEYLMDTNSLSKQVLVLALFFVAMFAIAIAISYARWPG